MHGTDWIRWIWRTVTGRALRSGLTALGIGVGITAVMLLTAIGSGIKYYVINEFTQFGTHLIAVTPGKTSTLGISVGVFGTERPLSVEDAEAMKRLPGVLGVVPLVQGNAQVEAGHRQRRTTVFGAGPQAPEVWRMTVSLGGFLPPDDLGAARPLAVLGSKLRRELFGTDNPLGQLVRIGPMRARIIGVMEPKGQVLGFDLDDMIYVPVSRALELFDRNGVMEIDVLYATDASLTAVVAAIRRQLIARHGREDFTITTQDQMMEVLDDVLNVLTGSVAALGGISLLVGGVGILTIMLIAVRERTSEIGLLLALGGTQSQILRMFLGEAVVIAGIGGLAGLATGAALAWTLHLAVPQLPVKVSGYYALLSVMVSLSIGLAAGVLPARRAAALDPIEALRAE